MAIIPNTMDTIRLLKTSKKARSRHWLILTLAIAFCFASGVFSMDADKSLGPQASATNRFFYKTDNWLPSFDPRFSSEPYEREALRLIILEANSVATALHLPEKLPITEESLKRVYILPYAMTEDSGRRIGNVHTVDFGYFVSIDHKLSYVESTHQDEDYIRAMRSLRWPISKLDTNEVYQWAIRWLTAASIDVKALNKDCLLHIRPDVYANSITKTKGRSFPFFLYTGNLQPIARVIRVYRIGPDLWSD
jgi:hypothetical protein